MTACPDSRKPPRRSPRESAIEVIRRLRDAGHQALLAGGCVRDMLMGNEPKDFDVATDAAPERIVTLFRNTRQVGAKFGVVLVKLDRTWIEVATFRADLGYMDGRRPEAVRFTDAREDALRRDFTINGMFLEPIGHEVIDHVGGRADLEARLIRAIGDPDQRFAEDHLRILRAVRFAARLSFAIEPVTWAAIQDHAPQIARISAERIQEELRMILTHPSRRTGWTLIRDCGLLAHLWPGADRLLATVDQAGRHLGALPSNSPFELAWAVVLHPLGVDGVETVSRQLAFSNDIIKATAWMVAHQSALDKSESLSAADLKLLMAHPFFGSLLEWLSARLRVHGLPMTTHDEIVRRAAAIPPEEVAPAPHVTGHDIEAMGIPPGPVYRPVLEAVYYAQLNGELVDRAAAMTLARRLLKERGANSQSST